MKYLIPLAFLLIAACQPKPEEKDSQEFVTDEAKDMIEREGDEPTEPEATEIYEPVPPKVTVGENGVPSDAIVLFDGSGFDEWTSSVDSTNVQWHLNDDGSMTVKDQTGDIQTKRNFGSMQLHIEWKSPSETEGEGQSRANSGVFIQQRYEVQVLDNNDNDTYTNGQVGSIYKQSIPMAMASTPTGEWNSYDIIFHEPKFEGENVVEPATITVLHNGVLIQDNFEIQGPVEYIGWPKYRPHGKAPIQLQDHRDNSRVSYRNIWVREL